MRFTDSPEVELSIGGATLSFQQDNGSMHVGTSVWPCSLVLVKFAERWTAPVSSLAAPNPYSSLLRFEGARAVELGAGCGPAGMGLSLLGLSDIVLTDIPAVMPALRRNLKRNRPVFAALGRKPPRHAVVCWNSSAQITALKPPFDLVIAADVVYMEDSARQLVGAMEALVKPEGAVLLGYQVRSPEAHSIFWELCDMVFDVEKLPHEDLHPEYAYEETDVYVLRKKRKEKESENAGATLKD